MRRQSTYLLDGHHLLWLGPLCRFRDSVVIVDSAIPSTRLLPEGAGRWRHAHLCSVLLPPCTVYIHSRGQCLGAGLLCRITLDWSCEREVVKSREKIQQQKWSVRYDLASPVLTRVSTSSSRVTIKKASKRLRSYYAQVLWISCVFRMEATFWANGSLQDEFHGAG